MNRSLLVLLLVVVAASLGTAVSASAKSGHKGSRHKTPFIKCGTTVRWLKGHKFHLAPPLPR